MDSGEQVQSDSIDGLGEVVNKAITEWAAKNYPAEAKRADAEAFFFSAVTVLLQAAANLTKSMPGITMIEPQFLKLSRQAFKQARKSM